MGPSEIQDIVERAWEARYSQDQESCHSQLALLKQELEFPLGALTPESIRSHFSQFSKAKSTASLKQHLQCLLLTASLVRSEEGVERAEQLVEIAQEITRQNGLRNIFELSFQKALNYSARGDFSSALEAFVMSRLATEDIALQAMTLSNSYACLLHLGLCYEQTFGELITVLSQVDTVRAPTYLKTIMDQVAMVQAKQDFYLGNFSALINRSSHAKFCQLDYFKLWVHCLPYTKYYLATEELKLESLVMAEPRFYQKSYRLRTLQGLLHPADLEKPVPLEQIDRIYLWTWRWLLDPQSFPISKVLALFEELDLTLFHKTSTNEDHQLLNNALSWLSLFAPASAKEINRMLSSIGPAVAKSPLLEFEMDCIRALVAKRDQRTQSYKELIGALRSNPLWMSPEHRLTQLFQASIDEKSECPQCFTIAVKNIRKLFEPAISAGRGDKASNLVVDEGLHQIYSSSLGKAFQSEIMACALGLLYRRGSISCEEFLDSCFGIGVYDAFIHDAKIYNLLARLRALKVPDLRFGVKTGRVYATGSWAHVKFIEPRAGGLDLNHTMEWRSFISASNASGASQRTTKNDQWIRPQLLLRQLAKGSETGAKGAVVPGEFTRADVESAARVSRATANRILKCWREKGLIGERGQARSRVYFLKDQLSQRSFQ